MLHRNSIFVAFTLKVGIICLKISKKNNFFSPRTIDQSNRESGGSFKINSTDSDEMLSLDTFGQT